MNKYDSGLFGDGCFPLPPLASATAAEDRAVVPLDDGERSATESDVAGAGGKARPRAGGRWMNRPSGC